MGDILVNFVKQYYSGTPFIPREIMLQEAIEDIPVLEEWLTAKRGRKVTIRIPQKGLKEKLVELAARNAQLVLSQDKEKIKREEGRTIGAVKEIEQLLGMKDLNRMEAYDISNINGFETVGSMIVYEKGRPKRSDYRKFKLRTVSGPDDYASMHEVLTRRFTHGMQEQKELEEKYATGSRKFYTLPGYHYDGWRTRPGKYLSAGAGRTGTGYSGLRYGQG